MKQIGPSCGLAASPPPLLARPLLLLALTFDRSRGILFVQTPDPLTAEVLARRFHTTIMRAVHNLQLAFDGVPVQDVQVQSNG